MYSASSRAKQEKNHVLLDFFNAGWIGCQQMDAFTYPTGKVTEDIHDYSM